MRQLLAHCTWLLRSISVALFLLRACTPQGARAQIDSTLISSLLQQRLQTEPVVAGQLRHFMLARVPPLRLPADPAEWNREADRLRALELETIYNAWPQAWVDAPAKLSRVRLP